MSVYEELVRKLEERKAEREKPSIHKRHKITDWIGYCPECNRINIHGNVTALRGLRDAIVEAHKDWRYVCESCGMPVAKDRAGAESAESCWFCGGKRAVEKPS